MTDQTSAVRRGRGLALFAGGFTLAAVLGIGLVQADWGPRGGWGGPRAGGPGPGSAPERFARFCANDTARYQPVARLFVKVDLRLTKEQEAAFDGLADQLMPALEGLKAEACGDFRTRAAAAPDRLKQLAGLLRKAADAAEAAQSPADTFYASLDTAQKARVEEVLARPRMGPPPRP